MSSHHEEKVRATFQAQACKFKDGSLTLARAEYIRWVVGALSPTDSLDVLDVAAGTSHLARALAVSAKSVTAIDLTKEMLAEGRRAAESQGLNNMFFELGRAENLPFGEEAFDLVVSRFAVHHFVDPAQVVNEMVRVCKRGGRIGLIDMIAPDGHSFAYNHLERLRDPSHTNALTMSQFSELFAQAGLFPVLIEQRDVIVDVLDWLDLTDTPNDVRQKIFANLEDEIAGRKSSGMRAFREEGRLKFAQTWVIGVADR